MTNKFAGFNLEELRQVAQCLAVLNPTTCPTVESTMEWIASTARVTLVPDIPSYVETAGFCVNAYRGPSGSWDYKVTLSAFGVMQWLKGDTRGVVALVGAGVDVTPKGNNMVSFDADVLARAYEQLTPEMRAGIAAVIKAGETDIYQQAADYLNATAKAEEPVTTEGNPSLWSVEVGGEIMEDCVQQYMAEHVYDLMVTASKDPRATIYCHTVKLLHGVVVMKQFQHVSRNKDLEP